MNCTSKRRLLAGAMAASLVFAACGDDDDTTDTGAGEPVATGDEPDTGNTSMDTSMDTGTMDTGTMDTGGETGAEIDPDLEGSILVSGSSTVEPISAAVASAFGEVAPGVAIQVEGPGTSDGFARFCAGETDISDASRPIDPEEVTTCEDAGIDFIELKVAIDGLSVITSAQNEEAECLSFTDLWALLGPDATGISNWADAEEAATTLQEEVGDEFGALNTPYPDAELTVTAPGEESGTFDSFVEIVFEPVGEALGMEEVAPRPDYTASPNDNVIIEGIGANPTSLGWVGFAFVEENLDTVKPLQVDGGSGCVEPTPETIASGEYPVSRDLFIYVNSQKLEENPALAAFVDYYVTDEGLGVIGTEEGQVPYVPLADDDIEATRSAWESKETGTREGE